MTRAASSWLQSGLGSEPLERGPGPTILVHNLETLARSRAGAHSSQQGGMTRLDRTSILRNPVAPAEIAACSWRHAAGTACGL